MKPNVLNHVALLVPSVERSAAWLAGRDFVVGPPEEWPGEGTLEIYVGPKESRGRLLLMEPLREGAYLRAMRKRGPGLHHIAIDVTDLEAFAASIGESGWLLHPRSLVTFQKTQTLWLARPGVPTFIEVQKRENHERRESWPALVDKLEIAGFTGAEKMLTALRTRELAVSPDQSLLHMGDQVVSIHDIIRGSENQ